MLHARLSFLLLALAIMLVLTPVSPASATARPFAMIQASASPFVPDGLEEFERGSRTLNQIAEGFPSPAEARRLLRSWGWEGNAYYNYVGSTDAGTDSLEVSFHLFGSPAGATEAMSYFAAGRALMLGLSPIPVARIGDELLAISGSRDGVNETTIYLRDGAFLIRISAVAPVGDPTSDAIATAEGLLLQAQVAGPLVRSGSVEDLLPTLRELPADFVVADEGRRSQSDIAQTFLRPREAASFLADQDFQTNVYRYFAAPEGSSAYPGAATSVEVSLHLFGSSAQADRALPYYADGRAEALGIRVVGAYDIGDGAIMLQGRAPDGSGVEVTVYLLLDNVLARISAVSPDGEPTADALATTLAVAARA
ncbi:MAG: hypothetical protein M3Q03_17835 [Chloroflexota bacterium]|nr:hypothetical protein [Chloroflexota bacterium]